MNEPRLPEVKRVSSYNTTEQPAQVCNETTANLYRSRAQRAQEGWKRVLKRLRPPTIEILGSAGLQSTGRTLLVV
jgi:hypothetical protein